MSGVTALATRDPEGRDQMFRRPTADSTSSTRSTDSAVTDTADAADAPGGRARHSRRSQRREAADSAALQARLDRVAQRLAEVGAVRLPLRPEVIDNDAARRDPLTRPFASAATVAAVTSKPATRPSGTPVGHGAPRRSAGTGRPRRATRRAGAVVARTA